MGRDPFSRQASAFDGNGGARSWHDGAAVPLRTFGSSDEGDSEAPAAWPCASRLCKKAVAFLALAFWATTALFAAQAGWTLLPTQEVRIPQPAAVPDSPQDYGNCPCECSQGTATTTTTLDVFVTTTTTTRAGSSVRYPSLPKEQTPAALRAEDRATTCRPGDVCAFGLGWCTADMALRLNPTGFCTMGRCNGPEGVRRHPSLSCKHPPKFNVTKLLDALPSTLANTVADNDYVNSVIREQLDDLGYSDFTVELDRILTESFRVALGDTLVVWLVGCWPPERYVELHLSARLSAGRASLEVAGQRFRASAYGVSVQLRPLRADLECHRGFFVLSGLGSGSDEDLYRGGRMFSPDSLLVEGEITVECEDDWGFSLLCRILHSNRKRISRTLIERLPFLVAQAVLNQLPLVLGEGCPQVLHNTFSLLPYGSQECCEAAFMEDADGCLVGGQFNGRPTGTLAPVHGVSCEPLPSQPSVYTARCSSIPGNYVELSPGVCREEHLPGWKASARAATSSAVDGGSRGGVRSPVDVLEDLKRQPKRMLRGLRYLFWADKLLVLSICMTAVSVCCCLAL